MALDVGTVIAIEKPDHTDANVRLDRASEEYLRRIAPVRFRVAESDEERHESFHLRYDAIIDQGWANPESFPGTIEREDLDDHALHIVGWLDSQPVASCRLILPRPDRLLPVEQDFGIRVEPFRQAVEIDRMCISRQPETPRVLMSLALLSAGWQEVRCAGYAASVGRVSRSMLRHYRAFGFEHEILGPAQVSWNEERFPIRFTAGSATERFYERLERLRRSKGC